MSECHVLLVRHPETEANIDGRYVGRGNAPFTAEGLAQLERAPVKVAAFEPDVVWTSPLTRAIELATACARISGARMSVDERLVELDFGDAEGLTIAEINAAGMAFDYRNLDAPVAPRGESRRDIEARAADFCDDLLDACGRHVVVTHGGVFRASLVHLLGLAHKDIWAFHIHNAQMAYVRVIDGHGVLEEYVRA